MFEALPLVVALFRACLVDSSPGGPVVGVVARVDGVVQAGPEAADFVAGQGNEVVGAACGTLFDRGFVRCGRMARNAAASMDKVMCRYQGSVALAGARHTYRHRRPVQIARASSVKISGSRSLGSIPTPSS
jgi:hypothetical protein